MKISTFNPLVVSSKAEDIIGLLEEMGFEKRHRLVVDTGDRTSVRTRMRDANGFYADVSQFDQSERDMTAIRMNVDDFEEAFEKLTSMGFKPAPGAKEVNLEKTRALLMQAPSGFLLELMQHIKK